MVQSAERIRSQLFSLSAIPHQPLQRLHQPRIVVQKELFEFIVGRDFRPNAQKQCLVTLPHIC